MSQIFDPEEYLKIKYSAPTGACKCGNCQLVPPEQLGAWANELRDLRSKIITIASISGARTPQERS